MIVKILVKYIVLCVLHIKLFVYKSKGQSCKGLNVRFKLQCKTTCRMVLLREYH